MHQLTWRTGLVDRLNEKLDILQRHRPYTDSDHVLNIAYNVLCGGRCLDDIEIRRNDAVYLDMLGARSIPDPTTAGDFCRRFDADAVWRLMDAINDVRVGVWQQQPKEFFEATACIDADGSLVPTTGQCKQGMDISYKGDWGYHPLLVSLANTREALYVVNRSGNRPSSEGAAPVLDRAIELCRRGGFSDILLRGDTDFSQTAHLDRWDREGVRFVFGYDARDTICSYARAIEDKDYQQLVRRADRAFEASQGAKKFRAKQPRIKQEIVRRREYKNIRLEQEMVSEFDYQPLAATQPYRMVVLRKQLVEERGQRCLDHIYRYHFYITNDRQMTPEQVIFQSNDRCEQENLIEQLKNGVPALRAPLNTLESNWAYSVMAALAWNLKAWFALMLPVFPAWQKRHREHKRRVLRMEFRTFLQQLMLIPAQLVQSGRRLTLRFLAWRPQLPILFRLLDAL